MSEVSRFSDGERQLGSVCQRTTETYEKKIAGKKLSREMSKEGNKQPKNSEVGKYAIMKATGSDKNRASSLSALSSRKVECEGPSDDISATSSVDETYQVMATKDAWLLLIEKFEFTLDSGKYYCLPGEENRPGKNSFAVEGLNYFSSLNELRKHLCAYGLPRCKKYLREDEKFDIELWVRYAHVVGLTDAAYINPAHMESINQHEAWQLLLKLGLKYSGKYVIPSSDPSRGIMKFDRQRDFLHYLARFGIPCLEGCDSLSDDDRLKLDLFLASPGDGQVDTFQRIKPGCDLVEEIAPRRSRKEQEANTQPKEEMEHTSKPSFAPKTYKMAFDELREQRGFPSVLISSEEALRMLTDNFNISTRQSDGVVYFCLPDVDPTSDFMLGRDFFTSIQDMRKNLCAYGLPPMCKGSKLGKKEKTDLEFWVRYAHIETFQNEPATIPVFDPMNRTELKRTLMSLGYQFSKNCNFYALPDTKYHRSRVGKDRFHSINDLFNHIARFGLTSSKEHRNENLKEDGETLKFKIYVATVATFDVWKRVKCEAPVIATSQKEQLRASSIDSIAMITHGLSQSAPSSTTYADGATSQPAVVIDEGEESPKQSPQKKSRTTTIPDYFKSGSEKTADGFYSNSSSSSHGSIKPSSSVEDHENESPTSPMSAAFAQLSPSCLNKGVVEIEACFVESLQFFHDEKWFQPALSTPSKKMPLSSADDFVTPTKVERNGNESQATQEDVGGMPKTRDNYLDEPEAVAQGTPLKENWSSEIGNESEVTMTIEGPTVYIHATEEEQLQCDGENDHMSRLPDKQLTVKDKLECCLLMLHPNNPSYRKRLSKSCLESTVSSMEDDIKNFMIKSIETGMSIDGITSPSPGFMYICGGPGTGKTTAVSACADDVKKWAKTKGYKKPFLCHINLAAGHSSTKEKGGIVKYIRKKIAQSLEIDQNSSLVELEKQFKKKGMILILDEIDMLFKQQRGIGETFLNSLIGLAEDKDLCFSMIGISNCINDKDAACIREIGHPTHELIFPAYSEEDITAILEDRVGKKIIDPKALQLIARRVAASSGDARRALDVTSNAVGICLESLTEEQRSMEVKSDEFMPLVKLPHMMRAVREGLAIKHVDLIRGLPQAAKVILCIAVSLSQVWGPTAEISIPLLKRFSAEATHHSIMDDLSVGNVAKLVEMLADAGLLVTGNNGKFDADDDNAKLRIGVQLDDVECALEESLLKDGGFYRSLFDFVKRKCPTPEQANYIAF